MIAATACGDATTPGLAVDDDAVTDTSDGSATAPADATATSDAEGDSTGADTAPEPPEPFALGAVEPATADVRGGIDVLVTGSGFLPGMEIVFGESPALNVFVASSTTAVATLPPHPAGRLDVSAFHPDIDEGEPLILPGAFTYTTALSVFAVEPNEGDIRGGDPITLRGSGFDPQTRFFVGGRLVITQTRVDDATLTGVTPPGIYGLADIQVVNSGAVLELSDGFRYRTAPTIEEVTPHAGPAEGGTVVRLRGLALDGSPVVRFGATPAEVIGKSTAGRWVDVHAPTGAAGAVTDITVTTGWGSVVAERAWTWQDDTADLSILACSTLFPSEGPRSGGQAVTLTCRGLAFGVDVEFGDTMASVDSVDVDGQRLVVTTPEGSAGAVDVIVTSPFSSVRIADGYRYRGAPALTVTTVTPNRGGPSGGESVTIEGTGFGPGAAVTIGALPVSGVQIDGNTITAVTPPGAPGGADVTIRFGGEEATLLGGYEYVGDSLSVDLITPATVARPGGTYLRVYGTGFTAATTILIGDLPCETIAGISTAERHVRSPKLPVGVYDAVAVTPGIGGSADRVSTLAGAVTVFDPRGSYGGTWGGRIDETLNVTVRGTNRYGPVAGAFVIVGAEAGTPMQGYTDENGQVTFSEPGFHGPVDVTASREGFTSYSIIQFDATNVTVFVRQNPVPPTSGGGGGGNPPTIPPNAMLSGRVSGLDKYVVAPPGSCEALAIAESEHCAPCAPETGCLGDTFACVDLGGQGAFCTDACALNEDCPAGYGCMGTASGARCIPSPGEKIAYCNVTTNSLFGYEYPIQETAWVRPGETYLLDSRRLGELAVYCFGGYRALDGTFTPTVLGVKRHVFAQPGAIQEGIDIELEHQLRRTFRLRLQDPPTWPTGVLDPAIVISLELGADGVIPFSRDYIDQGDNVWLAPNQLADLSRELYDADYFFYTTLRADVSGPYPRAYNLIRYVTRVVEDRLPVRRDGAWSLDGTQLDRDLRGIWGASANQVYAVGESGTILLQTGTNTGWTPQTSQTEETLYAIDGRGPQDVWTVGDRGVVRHWDGIAWQPVDAPLDNYRAVTTAPGQPVYTAGKIRVRRYEGGAWSVEGPPGLQQIHGLDADANGRVVAVGSLGRIYVRDTAGAWSAQDTPQEARTLRAAWLDPASDAILAVGDGGLVLSGALNATFTALDLPTRYDLTSLVVTATGEVIIAGDNGVVLTRQDTDAAWETEFITDYRSKAYGLFAPPQGVGDGTGGDIHLIGSAAFILGPFLHFPIITAPIHDAAITDTTLAWTWLGGPPNEYTSLVIYPQSGGSIWTLIVDGDETQAVLPDIQTAAGFSALGSGLRRLDVTRVLNEDFDIDDYTTRQFSIYRRDSWTINQSIFYVPE